MSPSKKDLVREIKNTIGRFLSILLIVAVGVGFYSGVKSTSPSMFNSAEDYFNQQSLMDLGIMSTVGFGDNDVQKIREIVHVDKVMPAYTADLITKSDGEAQVARVSSLPAKGNDAINKPYLKEGRMPEKSNECILTTGELLECGLKLGDDITFEPKAGDDDVDSILKRKTFHVVGVADLPQYISYTYGTSSVGSGMITMAIMIPQENFIYSRYTEVYLTLDCHKNGVTAFDKEYQTIIDEVSEQLEDLGYVQYQAFVKSQGKELADAQEEYDSNEEKAYSELNTSLGKLNSAKASISNGLRDIKKGWNDYNTNSREYKNKVKETEEKINQAKNELAAGKKEWADSYQEYSEAKQKAESELKAAKSELDKGWSDYHSAKSEYDESYQDYSDAKSLYQDALRTYNAAINGDIPGISQSDIDRYKDVAEAALQRADSELATAEAELNAKKTELDAAEAELNAYEKEYNAQESLVNSELVANKNKLDAAKKELDRSESELNSAESAFAAMKSESQAQLNQALKELNSSQKEINTAKKEYEAGKDKYNAAAAKVEKELANAKNRLTSAYNEFQKIETGKWYVLDRDILMVGYSGYQSDGKRVDAIADVFAVFFLLVALLVCMSNMTRMVSEQRVNIGTYKALGYNSRQIASKYLIYAALASAGGCILGPAIFIPITPPTIFEAYDLVYMLPKFSVSVSVSALLLAVAVVMISTTLVAWLASRRELRASAAELMRPKAPPAGKKIFLEKMTFIWKRFSFFQKLTSRNLFRYKMRLAMTVIGIAGCMALVVSGFGMKDAMVNITDIQFNSIEFEDMLISFDDEYAPKKIRKETNMIAADERLEDTMLMLKKDCVVLDDKQTKSLGDTYLYMPEDITQASKMVNLHDPKSKESVEWSDDGVVVTEKIARNLGANIGDNLIMRIEDDDYTVKVAGISECYVYNYVFMTPKYYETVKKSAPVYNTVYATESSLMTDRKAFSSEWLEKSDKIVTVLYRDTIRKAVDDSMHGMEYIVLFMIVCAGILACIVLYNLTNANISERMREIATVKVLGFNKWEVNMYVFRDNLVMSLIGILAGSLIGWWLTLYLLKAVEISMISFIMRVAPICYLYAAGITLAFTLLINLAMTRRLRSISMVESLKAVE